MTPDKVTVNTTLPETLVIFREDKTPQVIEKQSLSLAGTIGSVTDFYEKRKSVINAGNSHVRVDLKHGTVILDVDDSVTVKTALVTGRIVEHPWINALQINSETTWEPAALLKKVKLSRMLFETGTEHAKMAQELANINTQISIEFATSDDFKGNAGIQKVTKLTSNIPTTFEFYFQPYVGMDKQVIQVEVQLLTLEGAVKIQLVSPKLAEVLDAERERQLNEAIEVLKELPIILS